MHNKTRLTHRPNSVLLLMLNSLYYLIRNNTFVRVSGYESVCVSGYESGCVWIYKQKAPFRYIDQWYLLILSPSCPNHAPTAMLLQVHDFSSPCFLLLLPTPVLAVKSRSVVASDRWRTRGLRSRPVWQICLGCGTSSGSGWRRGCISGL